MLQQIFANDFPGFSVIFLFDHPLNEYHGNGPDYTFSYYKYTLLLCICPI